MYNLRCLIPLQLPITGHSSMLIGITRMINREGVGVSIFCPDLIFFMLTQMFPVGT